MFFNSRALSETLLNNVYFFQPHRRLFAHFSATTESAHNLFQWYKPSMICGYPFLSPNGNSVPYILQKLTVGCNPVDDIQRKISCGPRRLIYASGHYIEFPHVNTCLSSPASTTANNSLMEVSAHYLGNGIDFCSDMDKYRASASIEARRDRGGKIRTKIRRAAREKLRQQMNVLKKEKIPVGSPQKRN